MKSPRNIIKSLKGPMLGIGFNNIDKWVDSGNYAINYINSGDFDKGFLFGRNYLLFGESGCHAAGTLIKRDNGLYEKVENIKVGDSLMSPNGSRVKVINKIISSRPDQLYKISTTNSRVAKPYTVNKDHIIHLVNRKNKMETLNVVLKDYMENTARYEGFDMIRRFDQGTDEVDMSDNQISDHVSKLTTKHSIPLWMKNMTSFQTRNRIAKKIISGYEELTDNTAIIQFDDENITIDYQDFFLTAGYYVNRFFHTSLRISTEQQYEDGYELYDFKVERAAIAKFYGFELEGTEQLYLLEDYTVTHNSAKSLLSATIGANAQKEHDALLVWIDVERATDDLAGKAWFENSNVDTHDDNFIYITASTLGEIKTIITTIAKEYRLEVSSGADPAQQRPIVFVVDSWAAALTESQWDKVGGKEAGAIVGDMGQKAKQLGDVVMGITQICSGIPLMVMGVQHVMDNQDKYGKKHKTTGGHKLMYMASGAMMLTKKEMRLEDVDNAEIMEYYEELGDTMTSDIKKRLGGSRQIVGIVSKAEVLKSRTSKPFMSIDIQIPRDIGIDRLSGLFDIMMMEGYIKTTTAGWYQYEDENGETVKFRKKAFREEHADKLLKLIKNKGKTDE